MSEIEDAPSAEQELRRPRPGLVRLLWVGSVLIALLEVYLVGLDRASLVLGLALIPAVLAAFFYVTTRWAVRRGSLLVAGVYFGVSVLVLMVIVATLSSIGGARTGP